VADDAGREVACWHVDRVLAGTPTAAATVALTADPESVRAVPVSGEQV
jgi:hypothetical protein